ncbi:MAG: phosphate acyltransferase PlsX [Anaerolineae bacterium]|nr:phosphate acyltransferase PlsX [Anaerolineae bacterium]
MRIVVDAMGSDAHPAPEVSGAVMAARESGDTIVLVGDAAQVEPLLAQEDTRGLSIEVVHTGEFISMDDHPAEAARTKKNSPMHIGTEMLRTGQADAFVSAGNTGGTLAVATLHTLKRIPGVLRPALMMVFYMRRHYTVLCDIGANTDCKAEWLVQFALMSQIYSKRVLKVANPRVGLLANGEEDIKGNDLTRRAAELICQTDLNFVGNVEPKEMLLMNKVDVMVHDGFSGNVLIKTYGAVAELMFELIKAEAEASRRIGAGLLLAKPGLRSLKHQIDPMEFGGALLAGVNGVVVVSHGRSNALGIKSAILRQARAAVEADMVAAIREGVAQYAAPPESAAV